MKKIIYVFAFLLCFSVTYAQHYQINNKISIAGDGGWDYLMVDELNQNLYVSHSSVAQVIDIKTGKLVGTIAGTNGIHGIAIVNKLNKGFTSNGKDSSVTVFDLKTFKIIDKVKVTGANPDAILYDPFSGKIFTFNGRSANATVIDATTDKVEATIPLSGKPEFSASDEKGTVYVNIEDKNSIDVIDAATLKVKSNWTIAPGEEPSGLALDNQNHRLFSVCDNNTMVVLNAETGKVVSTLPIGKGCDGVAFDPEMKRAYSSNGEGSITVVQEVSSDIFNVLETIKTQKGARTIAIDKTTHHLFVPTAEFGPAAGNGRPSIKPDSFVIYDIETLK